MYTKLKLLLVFLFCFYLIKAQDCNCNKKDELQKEFKKVSNEHDLKKVYTFLGEKEKEENVSCYLYSVNLTASLLYEIKEFDRLFSLVSRSRSYFTKPCLDTLLAENYFWTGCYYMDKHNSDSALSYYIRSVELAGKLKALDIQIRATGNISMVFNDLGQTKRSLFYLFKAKDLAVKANDENKVAIISGNIASDYGQLYSNTGNEKYLDTALQYQSNSIQSARKVNNEIVIQFGYGTMSAIYIVKKNYKVALQYCDSLMHSENLLDQNKATLFTRKADIYKAMGNVDLALQYADSSYRLALVSSPPIEIMSTMSGMIDAYRISGHPDKALEMMQKLMSFRDSITNMETTTRVSELEQKYNKSENEKKINKLNKENEIASLNVKILAVGILAAVLILVVIIFFYRQSVLKNKFKVLETEQRLNRARMDPHFFFNALTSIQTLSLDEENAKKVPSLIAKFSKIMRQSLESTYDELITIEEEVAFLTNYLDLQKLRYNNKFDYEINIDDKLEQDEMKVLGMLLQPFIENAIEHGFKNIDYKGSLKINFTKEGNGIKVELKDNGVGFNTDALQKEYPSRATQIINDRLALLNKKQKSHAGYKLIKNPEGKGILVEVILPLIT